MMKAFYNLFLFLYPLGARIISVKNQKAKKWLAGRKNIFGKLAAAITHDKPIHLGPLFFAWRIRAGKTFDRKTAAAISRCKDTPHFFFTFRLRSAERLQRRRSYFLPADGRCGECEAVLRYR
jgi:hypothetical protein